MASKTHLPADLDSSQPNMILVGDGGKDPSAEEYVFVPPGSKVVVAPKSDPKETPSMENAVLSVMRTMMKKPKMTKAQYGATGPQQNIFNGADGQVYQYDPAQQRWHPIGAGGSGSVARIGGTANSDPLASISSALTSYLSSMTSQNQSMMDYYKQLLQSQQEGIQPAQVTATADYGVGRLPATSPFNPNADVLNIGNAPSEINSTLGSQYNTRVTAMKDGGMVVNRAKKNKMVKAQYGSIGGYNTSAYRTSGAPITPYQGASLAQGDRQLAQESMLAQAQLLGQLGMAGMTNQTNLQRMALDRLLGEQQNRLAAQQQLATRATRQLAAPNNQVIPSLQPILGRATI